MNKKQKQIAIIITLIVVALFISPNLFSVVQFQPDYTNTQIEQIKLDSTVFTMNWWTDKTPSHWRDDTITTLTPQNQLDVNVLNVESKDERSGTDSSLASSGTHACNPDPFFPGEGNRHDFGDINNQFESSHEFTIAVFYMSSGSGDVITGGNGLEHTFVVPANCYGFEDQFQDNWCSKLKCVSEVAENVFTCPDTFKDVPVWECRISKAFKGQFRVEVDKSGIPQIPPECLVGETKCEGTHHIICEDGKLVNKGEIDGKCGYSELKRINVFRLEENECSQVNIYESEKTVNDYETLEECQESIVPPTSTTTIILSVVGILAFIVFLIYVFLRSRK